MIYTLRLFDIDLMNFSLEENDIENLTVDIKDVNDNSLELFPIEMEISNEGVLKWLNDRIIPVNRMFVESIYATMGLRPYDIKGIINAGMALSINDSYWVVEKGFTGKFADFNLYENNFSDELSSAAFTGKVGKMLKTALSLRNSQQMECFEKHGDIQIMMGYACIRAELMEL